jgi:hypothetical protein
MYTCLSVFIEKAERTSPLAFSRNVKKRTQGNKICTVSGTQEARMQHSSAICITCGVET